MSKLRIENISKAFKGKTVLDSISLVLESGKIYGIVGENGSGKTMFLRAISGLMKPSKGTIGLDNQILYKDISFLPSLGIIIENVGLYPEFTAKQNLLF